MKKLSKLLLPANMVKNNGKIISRLRPNGTYKEEIENMEVCKWRINEVCCNDKSEYLGDFPSPFCKCESLEDCKYFKKRNRRGE